VDVPESFKGLDVRKIRYQTYLNDSKPHAEIADNFIFTYPGSTGVYKLDPTAGLYREGRLKLFRKDLKGSVVEAPAWEEKHTWKWEKEKWHTLPPDLRGLLTHVEDKGTRLGILTYSQYDSFNGGKISDQFQQGRWELEDYLTQNIPAGPEDLWLLKTEQEDQNSPIAVEVSRTHHRNLQQDHGMSFWGETVHWISAVGNIWSIYDVVFKKTVFFQAGSLPQLIELKNRLAQTPDPVAPLAVNKTINDFRKGFGISFQDITPGLESHFQRLGHPPGPVVTQVDPQSPLGLLGLAPDDVILMANWEQTTSSFELQKVFSNISSAETLTLLYWRQGGYHWLEMNQP
jgi:hypothetical protein